MVPAVAAGWAAMAAGEVAMVWDIRLGNLSPRPSRNFPPGRCPSPRIGQ